MPAQPPTGGPNRFPVYIPTRGRPQIQMTAGHLLAAGIHPTLVVEDAEHDAYAAANPGCQIAVWPQRYFDDYEKTPELDPHPTTGAAHNFAWDHARDLGFSHHWIMDDNIKGFVTRNVGGKAGSKKGLSVPMFQWHEEAVPRFKNLAGMALGLGNTFGSRAFTLNTRLYCATLYRNDLHEWGIRWRRGLNDDTIVSLDILKTGYWCTAESHLLIIVKVGTSRKVRLEGGMTEFYAQGGFVRKLAEAVRLHPDCVKRSDRFGRIHHTISYKQFHQTLIRDPDVPGGRLVLPETAELGTHIEQGAHGE